MAHGLQLRHQRRHHQGSRALEHRLGHEPRPRPLVGPVALARPSRRGRCGLARHRPEPVGNLRRHLRLESRRTARARVSVQALLPDLVRSHHLVTARAAGSRSPPFARRPDDRRRAGMDRPRAHPRLQVRDRHGVDLTAFRDRLVSDRITAEDPGRRSDAPTSSSTGTPSRTWSSSRRQAVGTWWRPRTPSTSPGSSPCRATRPRPSSWLHWTRAEDARHPRTVLGHRARRLVASGSSTPTRSSSATPAPAPPTAAPTPAATTPAPGYYYVTYAGSSELTRFGGWGHAEIGIARSTDLVHWQVPG